MVNFSKFKSSPQGVLNWFKGHDQNKWKTTFELFLFVFLKSMKKNQAIESDYRRILPLWVR